MLAEERGDVEERPATRYAKAPDGVSIAYQVFGDGPLDIVFAPAFAFAMDLLWEEPSFIRFAKRLRGFSRTVWYEPRASEPPAATYSMLNRLGTPISHR